MEDEGWFTWKITRDEGKEPTSTLWDILYHLRNAVAPGRLTFTSDSPRIEDVVIMVEDKKNRNDPEPYWCANIGAKDLRTFLISSTTPLGDVWSLALGHTRTKAPRMMNSCSTCMRSERC